MNTDHVSVEITDSFEIKTHEQLEAQKVIKELQQKHQDDGPKQTVSGWL